MPFEYSDAFDSLYHKTFFWVSWVFSLAKTLVNLAKPYPLFFYVRCHNCKKNCVEPSIPANAA